MVIEDSEEGRTMLRRFLEPSGYDVKIFASAEEALTFAGGIAPDLILLDVILPAMNGYECCRILREREDTKVVPVIMITSLEAMEDKIRGFEAGADDFVTKPINRLELLCRIRSQMKIRELIHQQKKTEVLQEKYKVYQELEKLRDSFVSILSHELKTPLSVMKGYMDVLSGTMRSRDTSPLVRESLSEIGFSLNQLESLLNDLLDYSNLKSGKATLERSDIELSELIMLSIDSLASPAREKNQNLTFRGSTRKVTLSLDRSKILQVLFQLLRNAISFTPEGGNIEVELRDFEDSVQIVIADTGIGMSTEQKEKVFDPFYQADHYMTRRVGGMGLGLSIVKHIVENHGGRIDLESEIGRGTLCTITLPKVVEDGREMLEQLRYRLDNLRRIQRSVRSENEKAS
jgi:signal transduction histidine kinase